MSAENHSPEEIFKVDALGRVRVPAEQREALLDRFERSGMPGTRFAEQYGIKYQTFATWIQKRRRARGDYALRGGPGGDGSAAATLALAEVIVGGVLSPAAADVAEVASCAHGLRVELPGGAVLVVGDEGQAELAAGLMRKLSGGGGAC